MSVLGRFFTPQGWQTVPPPVTTETVTITAPQLLAMADDPVEIIAAIPNTVIVPTTATWVVRPGETPYTLVDGAAYAYLYPAALVPPVSSGYWYGAYMHLDGFLDQIEGRMIQGAYYSASGVGSDSLRDLDDVAGQALVLTTIAGSLADGDGEVDLFLNYSTYEVGS